MKAAIITRDGENIDIHFSKAAQLHLYEVSPQGWVLIEKRSVKPPAESRTARDYFRLLRAVAESLADCQLLVCSQIGGEAAAVLESSGIDTLTFTGPIRSALELIRDEFADKFAGGSASREVA